MTKFFPFFQRHKAKAAYFPRIISFICVDLHTMFALTFHVRAKLGRILFFPWRLIPSLSLIFLFWPEIRRVPIFEASRVRSSNRHELSSFELHQWSVGIISGHNFIRSSHERPPTELTFPRTPKNPHLWPPRK